MSSLRFVGSAFLTYPQFASAAEALDLENIKTVLLGQLSSYIREGKIKSFDRGVIAKEMHSDGNQHLHVFLHAEMNQKEVKLRHSDLDLPINGFFKHGNYQSCRSDLAVLKYCTKDGDYVWWGADPHQRQEARGNKKKMLLSNVVLGQISLEKAVLEDPNLIKTYDQISKNLALFKAATRCRPSGTAPRFVYLMGPSGVGKTTLAKSLHPEEETFLVPLPSSAKSPWWFDGYSGQRCLVFDNVSRETIPPYDLLCQMVDTLTCKIPVKGGHVNCSPSTIVITSVLEPVQLWQNLWDVQMKRRMTDLWVASTTLSTMGQSFEEMGSGLTGRTDVTWTRMDLAPWKILKLPPASLGLSTMLQRSLVDPDVVMPQVIDASFIAPMLDGLEDLTSLIHMTSDDPISLTLHLDPDYPDYDPNFDQQEQDFYNQYEENKNK